MALARRAFLSLPAAAFAAPAASLSGEIGRLEIADTHEHLPAEKDRISAPFDFFTLAGHYAMDDAVSAGLSTSGREIVRDPARPLEDRWRAFEPHWRNVRLTGYGRALREALLDLYGVHELSLATVASLNDALKRDNTPGIYMRLLREKSRIRFCVLDSAWVAAGPPPDPDFYRQAWHFDSFLSFSSAADIAGIEKTTGVAISGIEDMKRGMESLLEARLKHGLSAVKSTIAYSRTLDFQETSQADAQAAFERLVRVKQRPPRTPRDFWTRPFKPLEDHMMHALAALLERRGVPFQIHTGLFAGNASYVANSRPAYLSNLLLLYPKLTFDLFHIGFPYQDELFTLVKTFPNAYADFCWVYVLSERVAMDSLDKALDLLPLNKILGFGGDYRYPELIYAHAKAARRAVARVLDARVRMGQLRESDALEAARAILFSNAARLYPRKM
jgi:hypothetical protein